MLIHQVRLRRHDGPLGEVVAFDCAAAGGDEAGLVAFDRVHAIREGLGLAIVPV